MKQKNCLSNTKLVVCDIDGTLTRDGSLYPSEYTIKIIEELHKNGVLFGIASGRDVGQLRAVGKEWGLSFEYDIVIGLNGSEYFNLQKDKLNQLYTLSREDVKDIIESMIKVFPNVNASVYRNNLRLLRYEDKMAAESKKKTNRSNYIVKDLSEMWEYPCPKVMFRVTEEEMKEIEPTAISLCNDRFRCCKTQTTMLEFVAAGCNKGAALVDYCKENNIDIEDTVAFGDMDNDNELLLMAGTGVCMINGGEETKKCADLISEKTYNEDGCADFIEKYILKNIG